MGDINYSQTKEWDVASFTNPICHDCTKLGAGCIGSKEQIWTGCVHRTTLKEIVLDRAQQSNYTPASLMHEWALANGKGFYYTDLGSARIVADGKVWKYDHWNIQKSDDGTERVTVFLSKECPLPKG